MTKLIPKHQTPFQPLDVDERSDHRIEAQQTYEPIPHNDRGTIRDLGGSPSTDTRSSAERNKDYWHPIKGSWERFKTDWNSGRHPIQGLAKTFGTAILTASAPAAGKALIFNPLGSILGYAGGVAGSKAGEHVDEKLGVDNLFSVAGGITGGIKPYKYGTKATKRALEIAMRTNGGSHYFNGVPIQLNKDYINYILTGNKQSLQNVVNDAARHGKLYQGLTLGASSPSEVPLEQDPISNYLYGTEPGWAKVVDTDDLGVHTEYVRKHYPDKKIRVFKVEPNVYFEERVPFNVFSKKPIISQSTGSFKIITPTGNPEFFDAGGHLIEGIPELNVYRKQDIWKFNPNDYTARYTSVFTPFTEKLKVYYGTGLLDYHGTPFITRTPWLRENDPSSFNSDDFSNLIEDNLKNKLPKDIENIKNIVKNIKLNE